MNQHPQLLQQAADFHEALPPRIRDYLHHRGIPDVLIDFHLLGWNGSRIAIPIFDREGAVAFFKLAKDPEDTSDGPKMLATPGARAELYGWEDVRYQPEDIILCEGEFDRLVLKAQGFLAVTSTGGARVFRADWAQEFAPIPNVYLCFDFDAAGLEGALNVGRFIPQAKIIELPEEVGEGGDVTDFFVRLGRTDDEFRALMAQAMPIKSRPAIQQQEREARPRHCAAAEDRTNASSRSSRSPKYERRAFWSILRAPSLDHLVPAANPFCLPGFHTGMGLTPSSCLVRSGH